MRRILTVCLLLATSAGAQTMYKCQDNGKVEYSDKPCLTGSEVKRIARDGGPTAEDRGRTMMRLRSERENAEAIDSAERQRQFYRDEYSAMQREERAAMDERHRSAKLEHAQAEAARNRATAKREADVRRFVESNSILNNSTSVRTTNNRAPGQASDDEQPRKTQSQQQADFVGRCAGATCTGDSGATYTRDAGLINRYTSGDGKSCYRAGSAISCF